MRVWPPQCEPDGEDEADEATMFGIAEQEHERVVGATATLFVTD